MNQFVIFKSWGVWKDGKELMFFGVKDATIIATDKDLQTILSKRPKEFGEIWQGNGQDLVERYDVMKSSDFIAKYQRENWTNLNNGDKVLDEWKRSL